MTRPLALTLLLASAGCSAVAYRPLPRITDPTKPVECSPSTAPFWLDRAAASVAFAAVPAFVLADALSCAGTTAPCEGRQGLYALPALVAGLAYTAASRGGLAKAEQCTVARRRQTLCVRGSDAACRALAPDWRPSPPLPGAAP